MLQSLLARTSETSCPLLKEEPAGGQRRGGKDWRLRKRPRRALHVFCARAGLGSCLLHPKEAGVLWTRMQPGRRGLRVASPPRT